jgi:hypothetical protein
MASCIVEYDGHYIDVNDPKNILDSLEAKMSDGSVIAYRDADLSHYKQQRLKYIYDHNPLFTQVSLKDGTSFGVDLIEGTFFVNTVKIFHPLIPPTPLRLIYYKRMCCTTWTDYSFASPPPALITFFALGWQTTYQNKNIKMGFKVTTYLDHWEITEDI